MLGAKEGKHVKKSSGDGEIVLCTTGLTLTRSEFQRVGAATEKALVPMFVSTL